MVTTMAPFKRKSDVTRRSVRYTTRDGRKLTLRLIRPADAPLLEELFYRLSPESRWRRFHALTDGIPPERVRRAGRHHGRRRQPHAGRRRGGGGQGSGWRAHRRRGAPGAAAAASRMPKRPRPPSSCLTPIRGRALGSELLQRMLQLARRMKVKRILAVFQPDNAGAIHLFRALGLRSRLETSHGISKMYTELPE